MWYNSTFYSDAGSGSPTSPTVTLYVRDWATDALIANAYAEVTEIATDETEAKTLSSGVGTFTVNPVDWGEYEITYWVNVTAPGYEEFSDTYCFWPENDPVLIYLTPTATPGNTSYCYARFHVCEGGSGNPLPGAAVQIPGLTTKLTNSGGTATFEILKNTSYNYIVSKTDYATVGGSFSTEYNADIPIFLYSSTVVPTPTATINGTYPTPSTTTTPGSVTSHREAMRESMNQLYPMMPAYVTFAFFMVFMVMMRRGTKR